MVHKFFSPLYLLVLFSLSFSGCTTLNLGQQNIMSLAWYQSSGECRALYYQAFNTAKSILAKDLKSKIKGKKRAVVMDIDETIFDNSPASAREALDNKGYPYQWNEWIAEARAAALPGAVDFLKFADDHHVDIFYITNRAVTQADSTLTNLNKDGFPQAVRDHLYCAGDHNPDATPANLADKEARRHFVEKDHRIVLLCGDNLNDLEQLFWKKTASERADEVDQEKEKFGTKFIVLPNPVYGDWEGSIYPGYNYGLSEKDKDAARRAVLKVYKDSN